MPVMYAYDWRRTDMTLVASQDRWHPLAAGTTELCIYMPGVRGAVLPSVLSLQCSLPADTIASTAR
jgi:hypothetical protein